MKTIAIRLQDSNGQFYRWTIQYVKQWRGWQFTDHEGYTRFAEGNWLDLVSRFKGTAANYGLTLLSELS
jgi:hypothetical protein